MSYQAQILIARENETDLKSAFDFLTDRFSEEQAIAIELADEVITFSVDEWNMRITLDSSDDVAVESKEFSRIIGKERPDKLDIAKCRRRLEVVADEDSEMDYFSVYMTTLEHLEDLGRVWIYDVATDDFLN